MEYESEFEEEVETDCPLCVVNITEIHILRLIERKMVAILEVLVYSPKY